jgi:hypothetical protein
MSKKVAKKHSPKRDPSQYLFYVTRVLRPRNVAPQALPQILSPRDHPNSNTQGRRRELVKTPAPKATVSSSKTGAPPPSARAPPPVAWPKLAPSPPACAHPRPTPPPPPARAHPPPTRAHPVVVGPNSPHRHRPALVQDRRPHCRRPELTPAPLTQAHPAATGPSSPHRPPACTRPRPPPVGAHHFLVARWRWMFKAVVFYFDLAL